MTAVVAAGLRVVSAVRLGARLAHRPHPGAVVHLYGGPVTPSGRFIPVAGRTVCRARTRRLSVLDQAPGGLVELDGRRFCRRCTTSLPPSLGLDVDRLVARDEWATAYGHLTTVDLRQAAAWCRTVAETFQVGTVASIVLGGPAATKPVDAVLLPRRDHLRIVERTPDQQDQVDQARARAQELRESVALEARRRRHETRVVAAIDRRNQGGYLTPHERDLTRSA